MRPSMHTQSASCSDGTTHRDVASLTLLFTFQWYALPYLLAAKNNVDNSIITSVLSSYLPRLLGNLEY